VYPKKEDTPKTVKKQLYLISNDFKDFCEHKASDCFDCEKADKCPILNELFVRTFKKNGVNNHHNGTQREVHPKNALNELTGAEWLYFTKTLLTTNYSSKYAHELRKAHGANKPPELMKYLIEFFTKRNDRVLDPFAGVGGTLLGAAISNPPRDCVGIEINQKWIDIYNQVIEKCNSEGSQLKKYNIIQGDCFEILKVFPDEHFQFIATDPPYGLHLDKTMCSGDYKEFTNRQTDYNMRSEDPRDLANLNTYESYLDSMEKIFGECYRVLQNHKYMAIVIRNAYQNGEYIFTHIDLTQRAKHQGFIPKGEIVWYEAGTRLRPYGYPYAYVPNIAHQYILILQKAISKTKKKRRVSYAKDDKDTR
jgi:DNA modification methylase